MMPRFLLALGLVLAGGAAFAAQTPKAKPEPRKALCTVSTIGENFLLKRIGFTVFGNEEASVPIPDWKIDERVNALVAKLLQKNFQVKRVPMPSGGFASVYKHEAFGDYRDEMGAALQKIAGKTNCDFVLLVSSGGSQYASSNQYVAGLGVLEGPSFGDPYRFVHALPLLLVYDGKSFKLLREERHMALDTFLEPIHGPHKRLEGPFSENMREALTDQKVRELTWTLLESDLAKTIPKVLAAN